MVATVPPSHDDRAPIAIIGMGCRLPGDATSPSKFWDLLKNGKDAYTPVSKRWNSEAFHHPKGGRLNRLPTKGGHFLQQDPYAFDAAFFNIPAAEAMALDPKQRVTLEVTYEALESAGLPLHQVNGTQTACYMGSAQSDYRDMLTRDFNNYPKYYVIGNGDDMTASRLSHFFNIHGPSATIQTACSSSIVATHLACQSLRTNEAELAIAGGVTMILSPDLTIQLNNLQAINPDGHSRSFDKDANGYARGEGAGVLILKRLDKALRDGDPIRAIIRGSGVNSDGWTQGITMPSGEAQEALIKSVYARNGLDFASVQYVEAHGTGTKAGDPIETGAIARTIGTGATKSRKLLIGSVKPNIGHLEAAAGVVSIIKGVLAMENGMLPPQLLYTEPNPAIHFDEWNMAVPTKLTPWPAAKVKRMSINGFGIGGTNGHVVLEAFDAAQQQRQQQQQRPMPRPRKRLFVLSSSDQAGLRRVSDALVTHLDSLGPEAASPEYLANLAHTLAKARSGLSWRTSCVADSLAQLRHQLQEATARGQRGGDGALATRVGSKPPRIGFIFTGQGAQWAGMGVELLAAYRVFRDSVAQSAAVLSSLGCAWDPVAELQRPKENSRLKSPEISQPICTVLQVGLVDLLRSWGVTPSKVVGHSSGEIAAAYCAGALTHRDAISVAYFRGQVSAGLVGLNSGMMAVGCSAERAKELLAQHKGLTGGKVTVACINSPSSVTLSGDALALDQLRDVLEGEKVFARRLQVEVAYHSSYMQGAAAEYSEAIADLEPQPSKDNDDEPAITFVSSVTGQECSNEMLGGYYWVRNLMSPVLFSQALHQLVQPSSSPSEDADVSVDLLVEVGPHSALGGAAKQILKEQGITKVGYQSTLVRFQNAVDTSLQLAADLFAHGVRRLDMEQVNGDAGCALLTDLPPYAWNHAKSFRCDSRISREALAQQHPTRSLLGAPVPMMDETQHVWRHFLTLEDEPWLRGHMGGSTVVFPAAGMLSTVLEAAQQVVAPGKTPRAYRIRDVAITTSIALSDGLPTEVIVHLKPRLPSSLGGIPATWYEFTVSSCASGDQLRDHCRGYLKIEYDEDTSAHMAAEDADMEARRIAGYHATLAQCPIPCSKERFYGAMNKALWNYSDAFQGIENCRVGALGHGAFDIRIHDIGETLSKGHLERPFLVHAATLDAVFQSLLSSTWEGGEEGGFKYAKPYVPTHLGELEVSASIPGDVGYLLRGFCTSERYGFTDLSTDVTMFDQDVSKAFIVVKDFRVSETSMDGDSSSVEAGSGGTEAHDPADTTSVVRWDYSLDFMTPENIRRVITKVQAQDRLAEILKVALHNSPGATVTELVPNYEALGHSAMATLPDGLLPPNRVHFAVATHNDDEAGKRATSFLGHVFELGDDADSPLPSDLPLADLLIISPAAATLAHFGAVLERALALAKPDAIALVAASAEAATPTLQSAGFDVVSSIEDDRQRPLLYCARATTSPPATNGQVSKPQPKRHATLLAPDVRGEASQIFAQSLRDALEAQDYQVAEKTLTQVAGGNGDAVFVPEEGSVLVSLLELETPLLANLSPHEYKGIKALFATYKRLLWITHGDEPTLGLIDGLSRCVGSEMQDITTQVLHLSARTGLHHGPSLAVRILTKTATKNEDEYLEDEGLLRVARMYRSESEKEAIRHHLYDAIREAPIVPDEALRLTVGKPGLLDTLHYVDDADRQQATPLASHEVAIEVKASGINFRDIMAAMGLIPMTTLGLEGSGIVTATGALASRHFQKGDRVSFMGLGAHATQCRTDYRLAVKIPDTMPFAEAAALPVVYITAYQALINMGRLRKGQSVLIHAGAGGVGQAAIQIAQHLGLTIYTTAGSPEKRKLLTTTFNIPEAHIFYSRDASFAKGIMRVTNGRGVDCVLDSLSGELLKASWECLAPFGTLIEIGLRDILDNAYLDMRPFAKGTTFTFLDTFGLLKENPDYLGEILRDAFALIRQESLQAPTPLTVTPMGKAGEAFRTVQQGKHRGKMVLSFVQDATPTPAPVLRRARDSLQLDPRATYLLVGGLGGLGRSLARQFVACGARNLAFLSRSGGETAEARALVQELSIARVQAFKCDVTDTASFRAAMDQCARQLPPVKGVIQMAMVLRDTVFETMDYDAWTTGLKPKVHGTRNLHEYFGAERPLDFFIICSSISGITGNIGQAQYCAGNTYQDTLAHYRRSKGLKAISVNLGIMRDVGVIAEHGVTGHYKLWEEALGIREPTFHALFKGLINRQQSEDPALWPPAQVTTGLGTADMMITHGFEQPWYFGKARFGPLAVVTSDSETDGVNGSGGNAGGASSVASQLLEAGSKERAVEIITDGLVGKVAEILQMPPSDVDPGRPMYRYGVDSLVALEVRNWISKEMKSSVALLEVLAAVPMTVFAATIADKSEMLTSVGA